MLGVTLCTCRGRLICERAAGHGSAHCPQRHWPVLFLYIVRNACVQNILRNICIRTNICIYGCGYMDMQTDIWILGYMDIWIFGCIYIIIYTPVYTMCIYSYIYIYMHNSYQPFAAVSQLPAALWRLDAQGLGGP